MTTTKKKKQKSKTTNEKPVSIHPLEFEEALKALLKTPTPKEEKQEEKEPSFFR